MNVHDMLRQRLSGPLGPHRLDSPAEPKRGRRTACSRTAAAPFPAAEVMLDVHARMKALLGRATLPPTAFMKPPPLLLLQGPRPTRCLAKGSLLPHDVRWWSPAVHS